MTAEEVFQAHLDAHPDDWVCRVVFADWLQEQEDERAEGYRALGKWKIHPCPIKSVRSDHSALKKFPYLCCLAKIGNPLYRNRWGVYEGCALVEDWFNLIALNPIIDKELPEYLLNAEPIWWKYFTTRREADEAAAIAFQKLPGERRLKLLDATLLEV